VEDFQRLGPSRTYDDLLSCGTFLKTFLILKAQPKCLNKVGFLPSLLLSDENIASGFQQVFSYNNTERTIGGAWIMILLTDTGQAELGINPI
jgi:hypothetical protein